MPSFIYSPALRVYIKTEQHGTLDISDDLASGTLVRRSDGVSTFDFELLNARRKYDGVFTPNDRIVVMMKRITWLRVFTGYLNSVPLRTAWPRNVSLSASCSLKRLQYWYWDPNSAASRTLMLGQFHKGSADGGLVNNMIMTLLEKVVGWPRSKVHLGKIPDDWYAIAGKIAERVRDWSDDAEELAQAYAEELGIGPVLGGTPLTTLQNALGLTGSTSNGSRTTTNLTGNPDDLDSEPTGTSSAGITLAPGKYGDETLNAQQLKFCQKVYDIGSSTAGIKNRDLIITIMAARQESILTLDTTPFDGSSSLGPFQMIAAHGSAKDRSNWDWSIRWFLGQLKSVAGRDSMGLGQAAQAVERSAYPGEYDQWAPMAKAVVSALNRKVADAAKNRSQGGNPPVSSASKGRATGLQFLDKALMAVAGNPHMTYVYGGDHPNASSPDRTDCSGFVRWALYHTLGGSLDGAPRTSSGQAGWCQRISVEQALKTPGALLFVSSNGQPSGVHHVEISLGGGNDTVGAHSTRSGVGVAHYKQPWSFGGLVPSLAYSRNPFTGPVSNPTTSVSSGGTNAWPVASHVVTTPYKKSGSAWSFGYHTGSDFGNVDYGDDVRAVAPGKVEIAGPYGAYGNAVTIKSGNRMHLYGHLSQVDVSHGETVTAGQKIGEVGNTGNVYPRPSGPSDHSSGVHLHFEVRKAPYTFADGNFVDPVTFIKDGHWDVDPNSTVPAGSGDTTGGAGPDSSTATWEPPLVSELPNFDSSNPIDQLFAESAWYPISENTEGQTLSAALTGPLTLMNDEPLLQGYLKNLFASTMHSFCSAPNGDLIAWFPDYYGIWGTAAILRVEEIEVQDFNVTWSDDYFVTHQFVQKAVSVGLDTATGLAQSNFSDILNQVNTKGIANIDMPEVMYSLFGFPPKNSEKFAKWVYKKFGARPNFQQAQGITSASGEFFMALYYFMLQWAYQYQASIPVTFMPEAWPGMLIQIPAFNFQAYMTTVTHTFTFGEEGRFETSINIAAPAYLPGGGKGKSDHALLGLPLAGGYVDHLTSSLSGIPANASTTGGGGKAPQAV